MKIIISLILIFGTFGLSQASELKSVTTNNIYPEKQASILLNTDTYSVSEGLSQSTVTSLVEDKDGYVWIGTLNGLNRFDGENFKHYFSNTDTGNLLSSFIRSLLIDSKGRLLIGTNEGLFLYNRKLDNFNLVSEEIKKQQIWSINEDAESIIIGTDDTIHTFDKNLNYKSKITEYDFGGIKRIIVKDNDIFIRSYNGKIYSTNSNLTLTQPKKIAENSIDLIEWEGKVLVLDEEGIIDISKEASTKANVKLSAISSNRGKLVGIFEDEMFTSVDGFNFIRTGKLDSKINNFDSPNVYHGNKHTFIAVQNNGFISISEQGNIISTINLNANIWSINKNEYNNLIISSDSELIHLYDEHFNLVNTYNIGIVGPKTAIMKKNKFFIATSLGLIEYDVSTNTQEIISNEKFFIVSANSKADEIYSGTINGKLIIVNPLNKKIKEFSIDPGNPIFDVKSKDESIWIGTQGGLFRFIEGSVEKIFNEDLVISLYIDNDDIYFGTRTSLLKYNLKSKKTSEVISYKHPIYSISVIDDYLIASSVKNIFIINKETGEQLNFSSEYGSQDEYNTQSITALGKTFYLGGISGISKVDTESISKFMSTRVPPTTTFSNLSIFNIPEIIGNGVLPYSLNLLDSISLKYSDYPFSIGFSSQNSIEKDLQYAYQLTGLSDSWVESKGINSATYTNLSPGNYTFNVYARDPLTQLSGPVKSINIEIIPPWWLSKQAKLVYFIITLIISAVIVQAILRRREVQKQIAKSEERLKLSLWGSGDEMWDWDIETGQIYRSNIWGSLEFPRDGQRSGESGEESNIHPMDQERVSTALNNHFDSKTDHFEAAYRVKGKSDEWVWILDRAKIVERDEKDNPLRMTGTIKNINNFKNAEEQLRLFERAIANISEGMFILDHNFIFVEVNEACCDLSLIPKEQFIGSLFKFNLYPDSYSEQIRSILHQQGSWSNDVESAKGDGTSFLMELTVDAIYDEQGQLSHYVGVFSDISRRKLQEEELRKLTNNDLLTNLPNRSSLMVTLGNLVKRDTHHTLMVLDLDNFKKINDSMGHQVGDELLIKVAKRIEATVPYHTSIYRLGGDEFAILVDNNPDIGSSAVIANNVIDAFVSPFEITSEKVVVGLSIGIVLYPEDDQNEQALLRKADIAMYHAKSGGGNRYQFYSESINRNAIRQLEVENLIREGLRDDLFEVYYQPKIALKTGRMAGMEALVRLNHPVHGLIPPSEFIPLAEENGLIVDIGDLVMRKACFATQKWRSQGLFNGRVAVNLSSYQFALPDLQQRIESILRLTQLPAENLELEITEGTVIKQPEKAIKVMQQLSKMGVSLALDDFGTGYSSLSYLKRFPIHTLKIDKAFVDDIDKSDRDLKMVDSIITIAHNMGLSVVGEGVEDASQLSILKALNCEEIQGFIFSKAVTESDFSKLLQLDFIEPDIVQKNIKAT